MKNQKAFTLIELLVVIAIISILTSVLILSFRQGTENQKMQLFIENLNAAIGQARTEVSAGKQEENILLCKGILLIKGEEPKKVLMNFENDYCDFQNPSFEKIVQDSYDIKIDSQSPANKYYVLFVPPSGEMKVYSPDGIELSGDASAKLLKNSKVIEIKFNNNSFSVNLSNEE